MTDNPLLRETWDRPFGLPPFDEITDEHYASAYDIALETTRNEVRAIADNPEPPSFSNTIEAMERADRLLDRIGDVFWNLSGTDSNDTIEALERDLSPRLSAFESEVLMDAPLFGRVRQLQENRKSLGLTDEQIRVLDLTHRMFVRAGAALAAKDRERLAAVVERLAELGTAFSQNLLADERDWFMDLTDDDLAGCPGFVRSAAAEAARERGVEGFAITLSRSLIVPFLQNATRRDLRERAYRAWTARGRNGGDTDNRGIIRETLELREERARLLGFDCYADYRLEPEMAKTPTAVRELLMAVWKPALDAAARDAGRLQSLLSDDGVTDTLKAWDWHFYSERLRRQDHDFDEAELKPYLQLDRMIEAAFDCASRLFGLTFVPVDVPLYHPDVRAWDVRRNGRHLAVFLGDYFHRSSKRSGAWCSRFRPQSKLDGEMRPIVVNVCNFAKVPEGEPCLLTIDDARTLFHEFGHALHSMLSDVTYAQISGTSVALDFVELPSQLFENWLFVPEVLERFARHHETEDPMPRTLLDRLVAAQNFDQGFRSVEFVASALVDLTLHENPAPQDPMASEAAVLREIGMPDTISMRHASPHFAHIFSGDGYASGYYSYMWSEVMDADAFAAFEEASGPFDPGVAGRLHDHILSTGGSREAEVLYSAFRGAMPGVEALLRKRGFLTG
ncbi:MAG: M3 family metallopeptidase [Paracoccaceae bacterium]|nr:M3 family metallopeptidase [Paracoccaceae bacterium]